MKVEIAIYLMIAITSLLMISYMPHMFLNGYVSQETEDNVQIIVTIGWAIGLCALGVDIVRKRKGLKD